MKRPIGIIWLVLLLGMLSGCLHTAYEMQIHQAEDQITQIIMIDNTGIHKEMPPVEVLVINEEDRIAEFLDDLRKVPCYKFHNDPATSYGYLYVEITYQNGDIEIIGTDMLTYQTADGNAADIYDGWYYADYDSMSTLFEQYTGAVPGVA